MIILATAIILSLNNSNVTGKAKEAMFKADLQSFNSELSVWLAQENLNNLGSLNTSEINVSSTKAYKGLYIQDIIKSMD